MKNRRSQGHEAARAARARVVIVWRVSADHVSFLAWNDGNGAVRTYERDAYDERLGPSLPHFARWDDAAAFLATQRPLVPVQLALPAARLAFPDIDTIDTTTNDGATT